MNQQRHNDFNYPWVTPEVRHSIDRGTFWAGCFLSFCVGLLAGVAW